MTTPDLDTTPETPTAKTLAAIQSQVRGLDVRISHIEEKTDRILILVSGHLDRELADRQAGRSIWPVVVDGRVNRARLVALIATGIASALAAAAAHWGLPL